MYIRTLIINTAFFSDHAYSKLPLSDANGRSGMPSNINQYASQGDMYESADFMHTQTHINIRINNDQWIQCK